MLDGNNMFDRKTTLGQESMSDRRTAFGGKSKPVHVNNLRTAAVLLTVQLVGAVLALSLPSYIPVGDTASVSSPDTAPLRNIPTETTPAARASSPSFDIYIRRNDDNRITLCFGPSKEGYLLVGENLSSTGNGLLTNASPQKPLMHFALDSQNEHRAVFTLANSFAEARENDGKQLRLQRELAD